MFRQNKINDSIKIFLKAKKVNHGYLAVLKLGFFLFFGIFILK